MKKYILMAIISLACITVSAAEPKDTVAFTGTITKVVEDTNLTTTGKKTTKYYFLVSGYLIPTTKAAVEKYNLCKKYGAKCALDAVVNKKTREFKRIILG